MKSPVARAALTAALVVGGDQGSKALVRAHVDYGSEDSVLPGITLTHTHNSGVAFGMFSKGGVVVAVVTALALVALLGFFTLNRERALAWLPTGLLLGGAIGNVIDRLRLDFVTDFIKLPAWPAFNVADMAITFGVIALVYVIERPRARST
ncbi:MAG: signal peptidase [Solirubrobacteraceae bacterium]|nr:signal peptidase [Solirubrobacteraceae bacterium]